MLNVVSEVRHQHGISLCHAYDIPQRVRRAIDNTQLSTVIDDVFRIEIRNGDIIRIAEPIEQAKTQADLRLEFELAHGLLRCSQQCIGQQADRRNRSGRIDAPHNADTEIGDDIADPRRPFLTRATLAPAWFASIEYFLEVNGLTNVDVDLAEILSQRTNRANETE